MGSRGSLSRALLASIYLFPSLIHISPNILTRISIPWSVYMLHYGAHPHRLPMVSHSFCIRILCIIIYPFVFDVRQKRNNCDLHIHSLTESIPPNPEYLIFISILYRVLWTFPNTRLSLPPRMDYSLRFGLPATFH